MVLANPTRVCMQIVTKGVYVCVWMCVCVSVCVCVCPNNVHPHQHPPYKRGVGGGSCSTGWLVRRLCSMKGERPMSCRKCRHLFVLNKGHIQCCTCVFVGVCV